MPVSSTSRAAHQPNEPHRIRQRDRVLEWVRSRGIRGATQEEAADHLHIRRSSMCGCMDDLYRGGRFMKLPITRLTRAGYAAEVWIASEHDDGTGIPHPGGGSVHIGPRGLTLLQKLKAKHPDLTQEQILFRALDAFDAKGAG